MQLFSETVILNFFAALFAQVLSQFFPASIVLVILITGLTISVHVKKAALKNPIESIRDE